MVLLCSVLKYSTASTLSDLIEEGFSDVLKIIYLGLLAKLT